MKHFFLVLLISLFAIKSNCLFAQSKLTDSLTQLLVKHSANDTVRVNLLNELAFALKIQNMTGARQYLKESFQIANKLNYTKGEAECLRISGVVFSILKNHDSAYFHYQKAYDLFKRIDSKKGMCKTLSNLGTQFFNKRDCSKAINYHLSSLKIAKEIGDTNLMASSLCGIGNVYNYQDDFNNAVDNYLKSIELAQRNNDSQLLSNLYSNIAVVYAKMNNYSKSLEYCYKGIKENENLGNKRVVNFCLNLLGSLYLNQKDYPKSLEAYLKGFHMAEEMGDDMMICQSLTNVGKAYVEVDSINRALEYSQRGLNLANKIGDTNLKGENFSLLASIYEKQKKYNDALATYSNALKCYQEVQNPGSIALMYIAIARQYSYKKEYSLAISNSGLAYSLAKQIKAPSIRLEASEILHKSYAAESNFKQAYQYFAIYKQLSDSTFNAENTKKLISAEMQYKFDNELKQKELEQAKMDFQKGKEIDHQKMIKNTTLIFLAVLLLLTFVIYRSYLAKQKANKLLALQNSKIENQKQEILVINNQLQKQADDLLEMDLIKTRFFTNITHEFRTPLTLIMGPISALFEKTKDDLLRKEYSLILKHADRLLILINQLLELSKIKRGSHLKLSYVDIALMVRNMINSFSSHAASLDIGLTCSVTNEKLMGWIDVDKLEIIVINLISNAFKYTQQNGLIDLSMHYDGDNPDYVEIRIYDNGMGIEETEFKNIFEPFYRVVKPENIKIEGTGLGLAIVKEFVELHGGIISVDSKATTGTTFTVRLPIKKELMSNAEFNDDETIVQKAFTPKPVLDRIIEEKSIEKRENGFNGKPTVLVVEDNDDLRAFIIENLLNDYQVIEAENGKVGFEKAVDASPDLIIADIMMPVMNGIEMTNKLKTDSSTSHIPVILLTAKSSEESRIEGLEARADDYVVKPFNRKEFKLRVQNAIQNRQRLREKFERCITVNPSEIATTSVDEKFLQNALRIIESRMGDESLNAENFSSELGYSRAGVYKKLIALTGQPTTEFIRTIRLKRAAHLISAKAGNTSEIAYQTGFSNLSYFSRCFKKQYGVNPSDYKGSDKYESISVD